MSLSSSPSRSASSDICFVIESAINRKYEVYIVDVGVYSDIQHVSEPGTLYKELPPPVFEVPENYPSRMSFFGYGSKIYFLGGVGPITSPPSYSKEVYVYDTSNNSAEIKKVGSMNRGKLHPLVIGPIREKFYVLSHNLFRMDLEEFNPETDSWKNLSPPPTGQPDWTIGRYYDINGYVVVFVKGDYKILMAAKCGRFSYDIGADEWDFVDGGTLPFQNGGISIGKDLYLVYQEEMSGFRILNYNGTDWDDFQGFNEYVPQDPWALPFSCMSLDDGGLLCAVQSGYGDGVDLAQFGNGYDYMYEPPPTKHHVMIVRFVAKHGTKVFDPIASICYKEENCISDPNIRIVITSFPFIHSNKECTSFYGNGNKEDANQRITKRYKKTDEAASIDLLGM